ncbi:MAG: hypothetical protein IKU36_04135 [Bacteroidales bacterium]|nr:hypothetical protein [Bacteroidales bacterium]
MDKLFWERRIIDYKHAQHQLAGCRDWLMIIDEDTKEKTYFSDLLNEEQMKVISSVIDEFLSCEIARAKSVIMEVEKNERHDIR